MIPQVTWLKIHVWQVELNLRLIEILLEQSVILYIFNLFQPNILSCLHMYVNSYVNYLKKYYLTI